MKTNGNTLVIEKEVVKMNIYDFMSDSPVLSWCIALILSSLIFRIVNRFFRVINIWKNGYPPEHCDADGDFRERKE